MADQNPASIASALNKGPTFSLAPATQPANAMQQSNSMQPMAQAIQAQGRNNDSMLVHMTPGEVSGLNALAMQSVGRPLTINPVTGLPEAGLLESILPIAAGFALGPAGFALMSAPMAALTVGGIATLATGDIGKGLMAGLGAYGGAGLGETLAGAGAAGQEAAAANVLQSGTATAPEIMTAAETLNPAFAAELGSVTPEVASSFGMTVPQYQTAMAQGFGTAYTPTAASGLAAPSFDLATQGVKNLGTSQGWSNLGTAAAENWAQKGMMGKAATTIGLAAPVATAMQPAPMEFPVEEGYEMTYEGPYIPTERRVTYPGADRTSTKEFSYFSPSNPIPYADGGETDRGIKFAGTDYQGGIDPEFSHGFKPVEVATTKPSAPSSMGGKGFNFQQEPMGYTAGGDPIYKYNPMEFKSDNPSLAQVMLNAFFRNKSGGGKGGMFSKTSDDSLSSLPDYTNAKFDPSSQTLLLADGGEVHMEDGGFVMDARTVSEIGNGSSNAGLEKLASLGARPIQGRGDGVSDSIPANIGGSQKARVARDEAYFPPQAVERLGGAQKLYAVMDKAHKARKGAKRGQNTGGLKALMA